ncbi:MAG: RNA-binding protein [Xanthobacteraceae bacterium]
MIGNAVHVMRIATGEIEENPPSIAEGKEYARKGGLKGGKARAVKLGPKRRTEIAKKAAQTRWATKKAAK